MHAATQPQHPLYWPTWKGIGAWRTLYRTLAALHSNTSLTLCTFRLLILSRQTPWHPLNPQYSAAAPVWAFIRQRQHGRRRPEATVLRLRDHQRPTRGTVPKPGRSDPRVRPGPHAARGSGSAGAGGGGGGGVRASVAAAADAAHEQLAAKMTGSTVVECGCSATWLEWMADAAHEELPAEMKEALSVGAAQHRWNQGFSLG